MWLMTIANIIWIFLDPIDRLGEVGSKTTLLNLTNPEISVEKMLKLSKWDYSTVLENSSDYCT